MHELTGCGQSFRIVDEHEQNDLIRSQSPVKFLEREMMESGDIKASTEGQTKSPGADQGAH